MRTKLLLALCALLALTTPLVSGCTGSSGHGGGSLAPGSTAAPATAAPRTNTPAPLPVYGTRKCWPIVFIHGLAGFRNIGPLDYWMSVPDRLRASGFEVLVVQDKPFASIAERALEAKTQIVNQYPDPRVKINVIAHSMGGLDMRYMITHLGMGDRVASATSIGTPHHGTSVADLIGIVPGPVQDAINIVFKAVGWDMVSAINQLSTHYCETIFNPSTPDDPRVSYFSWTGAADPMGSGANHSVIDPLFWPTWSLLDNLEGENDGLVSAKSAAWGQFCGVFPADHLNEVGQPVGLTPTAYDYKAFYDNWASSSKRAASGRRSIANACESAHVRALM